MEPIVISTGDPAGIGPEVTFLAIQKLTSHPPIVLITSPAITNDPYYSNICPNLKPFDPNNLNNNTIYYKYIDSNTQIEKTPDNKTNAIIAYQCIINAVELIKANNYKYLVTAPISKIGCHNANIKISGHTTLLQSLFNTDHVSMAFYSTQLSIILTTIHIPLNQVEHALTESLLIKTVEHAKQFAKQIGKTNPIIGISGLNPHAGESGTIGSFEKSILNPLLTKVNEPNLVGPVSPDIIFKQAIDGQYDIVIALYHDQGLIPLKLLAFDTAVNVTIGLPICRTSPDHGTAYDIAFQQKANPNSMHAAIQYCIQQMR